MANSLRWAAWNLTPDGWRCGPTVESPEELSPDHPEGTLLAMIVEYRVDDPEKNPTTSVRFRATNEAAVRLALDKYGPTPKD
jgi:hypothetical protein